MWGQLVRTVHGPHVSSLSCLECVCLNAFLVLLAGTNEAPHLVGILLIQIKKKILKILKAGFAKKKKDSDNNKN